MGDFPKPRVLPGYAWYQGRLDSVVGLSFAFSNVSDKQVIDIYDTFASRFRATRADSSVQSSILNLLDTPYNCGKLFRFEQETPANEFLIADKVITSASLELLTGDERGYCNYPHYCSKQLLECHGGVWNPGNGKTHNHLIGLLHSAIEYRTVDRSPEHIRKIAEVLLKMKKGDRPDWQCHKAATIMDCLQTRKKYFLRTQDSHWFFETFIPDHEIRVKYGIPQVLSREVTP